MLTGLFRSIILAFTWRQEDNEKPVRICGNPTKIRTEYIPNTSLERHCYTDLLVIKSLKWKDDYE